METFERGSMQFRVRDGGPVSGPPIILLHGFPETSAAWRDVVGPLHDAGYRTLAPDLRGYSPGARPRGARHYRLDAMVGDVVALAEAAGATQVHLVGHDWGGALAWQTAIARPDLLHSLTVFSTPHPAAMSWAMRHGDQARRSLYMLFFNIPWLPELLLRKGFSRSGMTSLGISDEYSADYLAVLQEPGALEAALNWYRALRTSPRGLARDLSFRIQTPTTLVWGRQDRYLGRAAAERTGKYVDGPFDFVELDADHWLPEKNAAESAEAILQRVAAI